MTVEDLEVNRQVRAVFARNWVNLQRLDYGAVHGALYVRGILTVLREPPPEHGEERDHAGIGPRFLLHLERELLKVPGLRSVRWDIHGWTRTSIAWIHKGI